MEWNVTSFRYKKNGRSLKPKALHFLWSIKMQRFLLAIGCGRRLGPLYFSNRSLSTLHQCLLENVWTTSVYLLQDQLCLIWSLFIGMILHHIWQKYQYLCKECFGEGKEKRSTVLIWAQRVYLYGKSIKYFSFMYKYVCILTNILLVYGLSVWGF